MKKKIFSLIAVAAALVLAGCGEAQSDASSAGATPTSSKKATSSKIP
jgi:predicted small lipoprotein YifL